MVWRSKTNPKAKGCLSWVNKKDKSKIRGVISNISENSLKRILVLGTKGKSNFFLWSFKNKLIHFWFTRPKFFINY